MFCGPQGSGKTVALRKESVDRNHVVLVVPGGCWLSLSARRAWIEISALGLPAPVSGVALRKESVDRNNGRSVKICPTHVALRKESVDRNMIVGFNRIKDLESLSARRAWIEITIYRLILC